MSLDQLELTNFLEEVEESNLMGITLCGACHSRYFTFTFNFFPINLKVTAICQIARLFVIIIHLFLCRTATYKDIILKET